MSLSLCVSPPTSFCVALRCVAKFCASDWRVNTLGVAMEVSPWLKRSIRGTFEARLNRDITVPYVSQAARLSPQPTFGPPLTQRKWNVFFAGKTSLKHGGYASRRNFCDMLNLASKVGGVLGKTACLPTHFKTYNNKTLNKVESTALYFENMRQANFSAMIRGDTPSSGRIYDMFLTGTVPMLLSDNLWGAALPFPRRVPWKQLLLPLSERTQQLDGVWQMQKVMASADRAKILGIMTRVAPDVLWHVPRSRVADNLIEDAELMSFRYRKVIQSDVLDWVAFSVQTTNCYNHMKSSHQFGKPGPIGLLKVAECSHFPEILC